MALFTPSLGNTIPQETNLLARQAEPLIQQTRPPVLPPPQAQTEKLFRSGLQPYILPTEFNKVVGLNSFIPGPLPQPERFKFLTASSGLSSNAGNSFGGNQQQKQPHR